MRGLGHTLVRLWLSCAAAFAVASAPSVALASLPGGPAATKARYTAATAGLARFVVTLAPSRLVELGLGQPDEVRRATVGAPYRVCTVERVGDELRLRPLDQWRFPVEVDGRPRALLTVERRGGAWRAVALGGAALAAELARLGKVGDVPSEAERLLVRLFQQRMDFLGVVPAAGDVAALELLPTRWARAAMHPSAQPTKQAWRLGELGRWLTGPREEAAP